MTSRVREEVRHRTAHVWAILLAAGDSRRVDGLVRDESGQSVPKPYWSMPSGETMFDWAMARAARQTSSFRSVAIVAEQHHRWWGRGLKHVLAWNLLVQPANRGTGVGILFPLVHIMRRDPAATVIILPTDHFMEEEAVFDRALNRALEMALVGPELPILLGMTPTDPDPELGYIVPEDDGASIPRVGRFVEKPAPSTARELVRDGALWNSFVMVANGMALLRIFAATLPGTMKSLLPGTSNAGRVGEVAAEVYAALPESDFSRDVLAQSAHHFRVLPVPECGWADLGTVERVRAWRTKAPARQVGTACQSVSDGHVRTSVAGAPLSTSSGREESGAPAGSRVGAARDLLHT